MREEYGRGTGWTRDRLLSVAVSDAGRLEGVERVLPWESVARPIDVDVGPDGALYVLEYGTEFGGNNPDARLTRVEYSAAGTLTPKAHIEASATYSGTTPMTVRLSAAGSAAVNDEIVAWAWDLDSDGVVDARDAEIEHTFS